MKIERFETPGLAQYAYIVSGGGRVIVIDPMRDFDRYIEYAERHGLTITHVTETHIHADFASGAAALAEAVHAELALSAYDDGEHFRYAMPHRKLRNGDELRAGHVRLTVLHTPGHTPEHLSFVLFNEMRSASKPTALFTGDFLFVGSVGRPDLLGKGETQRLAAQLYRSLHHRIADLGDGLQLYPGHGAGSLCGSGMGERPDSTLGYERATQPLFKLSEEAFVDQILSTVPPMPTYYPRMKHLNTVGAAAPADLAPPRPLSPVEFQAKISSHTTVLDVRRTDAFGWAHIPGAINIGVGQNLALWAGWMLDPESAVLLVGDGRAEETARVALMRVGLDRVSGYLAQGMPAWIEAGLDFQSTALVSTAGVQNREQGAVVLDVRSDQEWNSGHIEGARHLMLGDLSQRIADLPRNCPIICVCGSGYRSSIAASLLQAHGFAHIASMDGGMTAWHNRALPTVVQ